MRLNQIVKQNYHNNNKKLKIKNRNQKGIKK